MLYIFMSVKIVKRPTFDKRAVHFDRLRCVCKRNLSSSYIHFEGRILNLIVSVNGHCIS